MDKKLYMMPEMEIVNIHVSQQMLAGSLTPDGDIQDNNVAPVDNTPGTEDDF